MHFSKPDLFLKDVGILTFFTLFFHFCLQSLVLVCPINQDPSYTLGKQSGAHGDKNDEQRVCKHRAHLETVHSLHSHPARGKSLTARKSGAKTIFLDFLIRSFASESSVPDLLLRNPPKRSPSIRMSKAAWISHMHQALQRGKGGKKNTSLSLLLVVS